MSSTEDYISRKRACLEEDISFTSLNCAESPALMHWNSVNYFQYICIGHSEKHRSPFIHFRRNQSEQAAKHTIYLTLDLFFPENN
jgi:hypothetical protein